MGRCQLFIGFCQENEYESYHFTYPPHSSTVIPNRHGFNELRMKDEIDLLTDWETEKNF